MLSYTALEDIYYYTWAVEESMISLLRYRKTKVIKLTKNVFEILVGGGLKTIVPDKSNWNMDERSLHYLNKLLSMPLHS